MPYVNSSVKSAAYKLLDYAQKPELTPVANAVPEELPKGKDWDEFYGRWAVDNSSSNALVLYLMTHCGFYQVDMSTACMHQARPWKQPKVSRDLLPVYDRLCERFEKGATPEDELALQGFQTNILLNMILKDLLQVISRQKRRSIFPGCLCEVIQNLTDSVLPWDSFTPERVREAKRFMEQHATTDPRAFFYRARAPPVSARVQVAVELGMIFQHTFEDAILLFLERAQEGPASSAFTAQWGGAYTLHYTFL
jgi:hypothetical protein